MIISAAHEACPWYVSAERENLWPQAKHAKSWVTISPGHVDLNKSSSGQLAFIIRSVP